MTGGIAVGLWVEDCAWAVFGRGQVGQRQHASCFFRECTIASADALPTTIYAEQGFNAGQKNMQGESSSSSPPTPLLPHVILREL